MAVQALRAACIQSNITVPDMTLQALDSPDPRHIVSNIAMLKAQGLKAAILYISPINPSGDKTAKKDSISTILAAGIDVGFVCEGWGGSSNFAHQDINATCGARDGAMCGHWLDQLGAPASTAVYPTVDNDASTAQITQLCLPYFHAFRTALPQKYRMGAYGCGALLAALDAAELINFRWLSNALGWNGSRVYRDIGKWDIFQGLPTKIAGIDIDPDQLNPARTEFGFWRAAPAVLPVTPVHATLPPVPAAAPQKPENWLEHLIDEVK